MADFKAVIFDLDGTLLYTLDDLADSLNQVLREEGLPTHNNEDYRLMVGNGLEMLVARALPAGLRIPAHVRPVLKKFVELYRARQCDQTRPYTGVKDMLKALSGKGIKLAILSNKNHSNTVEIVEHYFPGIFQAVMGMKAEYPGKPDPAGALEIAAQLALLPQQIIFLGDSNVDIKTAIAAGMFPVGAAWGYRSREELQEAGASDTIDSPLEFMRLFHE